MFSFLLFSFPGPSFCRKMPLGVSVDLIWAPQLCKRHWTTHVELGLTALRFYKMGRATTPTQCLPIVPMLPIATTRGRGRHKTPVTLLALRCSPQLTQVITPLQMLLMFWVMDRSVGESADVFFGLLQEEMVAPILQVPGNILFMLWYYILGSRIKNCIFFEKGMALDDPSFLVISWASQSSSTFLCFWV